PAALGGAEFVQRIRGVEAPQPRTHSGSGRFAIPSSVADQLRGPRATSVRRQSFSLWHRAKSADTGAVSALCARTGHCASPRHARRNLSRGNHGFGEDLTTLTRALPPRLGYLAPSLWQDRRRP